MARHRLRGGRAGANHGKPEQGRRQKTANHSSAGPNHGEFLHARKEGNLATRARSDVSIRPGRPTHVNTPTGATRSWV
jgi:hypothetical protein